MNDPLSIEFLSEAELAKRWRMTTRSLQGKRLRDPETVPPFLKLGKHGVRYPTQSVFAFEQNLIEKSRA